jgi:hypothetical protein
MKTSIKYINYAISFGEIILALDEFNTYLQLDIDKSIFDVSSLPTKMIDYRSELSKIFIKFNLPISSTILTFEYLSELKTVDEIDMDEIFKINNLIIDTKVILSNIVKDLLEVYSMMINHTTEKYGYTDPPSEIISMMNSTRNITMQSIQKDLLSADITLPDAIKLTIKNISNTKYEIKLIYKVFSLTSRYTNFNPFTKKQ